MASVSQMMAFAFQMLLLLQASREFSPPSTSMMSPPSPEAPWLKQGDHCEPPRSNLTLSRRRSGSPERKGGYSPSFEPLNHIDRRRSSSVGRPGRASATKHAARLQAARENAMGPVARDNDTWQPPPLAAQPGRVCVETAEFRIQNDEFCIENDVFCI